MPPILNGWQLHAQVLSLSVAAPQLPACFKEGQNLNFSLLSDFNKEASKAYDCLYKTFSLGMKGVFRRAIFVIDEEGIIRYAKVLENARLQPNFTAIRQALKGEKHCL